jgi:hypothetical protein
MARKPAASRTPGEAESAVRERVGPLAVERVAKADGRALILYSRAESPARAEQPEREEREPR